MYLCKTEECSINQSEAQFPTPMNCPGCGQPLVLVTQTPVQSYEPTGLLIDRLPFPVAYPWHMTLDTGIALDSVMRVNNMIFTAYQAMRVTGLLLLSDYLESEESCLSLGKYLAQMHMPHWREWASLTGALAKFITGNDKRYKPTCHYEFINLADSWRTMGAEWKKDERSKKFVYKSQILSPAEIFQVLRNDRAHRLGIQDGIGNEDKILTSHLPVLQFMLEFLFAKEDSQLLRLPISNTPESEKCHQLLSDPATKWIPAISLAGVHPDFKFPVTEMVLHDGLRQALQKSPLVARHNDRFMPIYPFFLALDQEAPDSGGLIEPVAMVDAFSEKNVAYLGIKSHGILPGLGEVVVNLLAKKKHELGLSRTESCRELMVEWTRDNAATTLANLTMRKYFPQCYIERQADKALLYAVNGQRKSIVIAGEAGSGKSSLLCRFVENLLQKAEEKQNDKVRQKHFNRKVRGKDRAEQSTMNAFMSIKGAGDVVIFMSGSQGVRVDSTETMEHAFCRALLKSCGVKENEFNTPLGFIKHLDRNTQLSGDKEAPPQVWIILDAINEVDRFIDFGKVIDRFILDTINFPWLQVICSLRTGSLDALQAGEKRNNIYGSLSFHDAHTYHIFSNSYSDGYKEEPFLALPVFSADETKQAYESRQQKLPSLAALNSFTSLPSDLLPILASPLYLHVFHEAWKGENANFTGINSQSTLFETYLNSLEKELPGINETIEAIGKYMYEHETPLWPEEEAWSLTQEWFKESHYDSASQVCTLTPVESLVSASLLMRPTDDQQAYQFSHQKICEEILKRRLQQEWHLVGFQAESVKELDNKESAKVEEIFQIWLEKGERFDWLANAAANFLAEFLHSNNARYLRRLPGITGKVTSALQTICQAILIEMCTLERLDKSCFDFIQSGFKPGTQYSTFISAFFETYNIASTIGKSEVILNMIIQSVSFHEELVALEPNNIDFKSDISSHYSIAGVISERMGEGEKSFEYFKKEFNTMEELVELEPDNASFKRDLSVSCDHVGDIFKIMGKRQKAFECYEKALDIMKEALRLEPDRISFKRDLSINYSNIGYILKEMGEGKEALEYFNKALNLTKEALKLEPDRTSFKRDLSISYDNVGNILKAMGERENAIECFEKAINIMEKLLKQEPDRVDFKRDIAVSYNNTGHIFMVVQNWQKALECFGKSLKIRKELLLLEPNRTDFKRDLSITYDNVGHICGVMGKGQKALGCFEKALKIKKEILKLDLDNTLVKRDLSIGYDNIGHVFRMRGKRQKAYNCYKNALEIRKELLRLDPDKTDWLIDLGACRS